MAKKRELVWLETPVFMGWGCNLCSWKYQIPKTAATSKSPSLETRSAFLDHRCAPTFKHKDVRWNKEIQEWFCAKCGRTSDHTTKEDALTELAQYKLAPFSESDRIVTLALPPQAGLLTLARSIEIGMKTGTAQEVRVACEQFLKSLSRFYQVLPCGIRVLASRPLRVRENWSSELFGDYGPSTMAIRVWMRTAVKKDITSFGTFLNTLCHEYCHHLDFQHFKFRDSWHTRGFYERAAVLYHQARGTAPKRLFWAPTSSGRWRIDWPRTNRG